MAAEPNQPDPRAVYAKVLGQLQECANADMSEDEAQALIWRSLTRADRDALLEVAFDDMTRQAYRQVTRRAERVVWDEFNGATIVELREKLAGKSFRLPNGTRCEWTKATAKEHRTAEDMYRKMAEGHLRAAELHRRAAEAIEEADVNCLDDIEEEDEEE